MCAWALKIAGVRRLVLGLRHADLGRTDLGRYSVEAFCSLVGYESLLLDTGVRTAAVEKMNAMDWSSINPRRQEYIDRFNREVKV